MQQAPIALVEATLEERVEHIHKEYVQDALAEYAAAKLPETELQAHYEGAVHRIKRRLGGVRVAELTQKIQQAFSHQGDHRDWISYLLREYYDPMYDFQLTKSRSCAISRISAGSPGVLNGATLNHQRL